LTIKWQLIQLKFAFRVNLIIENSLAGSCLAYARTAHISFWFSCDCFVVLVGGAYHAGAAAVRWTDCNAARRPAPKHNDPEGTTVTQLQLI